MSLEDAVALARTAMRLAGLSPEDALASQPLIPAELHEEVLKTLRAEREADATIIVRDVRMLAAAGRSSEWLRGMDRQGWYYWPRLRQHLLIDRDWSEAAVRSVDEATDRILGALEDPRGDGTFDVRGLVVGFVQSGKTANYSAVVAKAADAGYRLFIVLSGVHDSLRQQTQRRLNGELVGGETTGVSTPTDEGRQWLTFTKTDLHGDFQPGTVDAAALAGNQPALLVVKKNRAVLERLIDWLHTVPPQTRQRLPVLIIDDEADQASPNTRGNRAIPDADGDIEDVEEVLSGAPPSRINELVRRLIGSFSRVAYVAYTATPFANVLIDHEAQDALAGADLYPSGFIVALPQPAGYYGAERMFGSMDDADSRGLDVIRHVSDEDRDRLVPASRDQVISFEPDLPPSLLAAIDDFVLAAAGRSQRGSGDDPATMLVHASYYQITQQRLFDRVNAHLQRMRDDWRYNWAGGLEDRLKARWESDFQRVTREVDPEREVEFDAVRTHITLTLEHPIQVLQINSTSEDVLDYARDPSLKAIVIGGNRLSRGLTLEGLLVSYYVRRANTYDTLMQMGRWFGFRDGYADLTRIYTTVELEQWFRDLVSVEIEVRQDIQRYAEEGLTPLDFAVRIRRHPALLVTDRLKMRNAHVEAMSFADQLVQTIVFPFDDPEWLAANLEAAREFIQLLGNPHPDSPPGRPMWRGVATDTVLDFLRSYRMDPRAVRVNQDLLVGFIERQAAQGELVEWTVGVMGQERTDPRLGTLDLNIPDVGVVKLVERTRLADADSLGVITSPAHLGLGLSDEQLERAGRPGGQPSGRALRQARDPREGLLLIYPISRRSGWDGENRSARGERMPIFADPDAGAGEIIGIALAFPPSETAATVEYVVGTVGTGDT